MDLKDQSKEFKDLIAEIIALKQREVTLTEFLNAS